MRGCCASYSRSGSDRRQFRASYSGSDRRAHRGIHSRSGSDRRQIRASYSRSGSDRRQIRASYPRSGSDRRQIRASYSRSGSDRRARRASVPVLTRAREDRIGTKTYAGTARWRRGWIVRSCRYRNAWGRVSSSIRAHVPSASLWTAEPVTASDPGSRPLLTAFRASRQLLTASRTSRQASRYPSFHRVSFSTSSLLRMPSRELCRLNGCSPAVVTGLEKRTDVWYA